MRNGRGHCEKAPVQLTCRNYLWPKGVGLSLQIKALSPQAKRRIERLWETLLHRLVVDLRMAGISSLEEANIFLAFYTSRHNCHWTVTVMPYFRSEIMSSFGGTGEMLILQKRWYLLCLFKSRPRQRQKDCSFILDNRSASFINFKEAGPRNWL